MVDFLVNYGLLLLGVGVLALAVHGLASGANLTQYEVIRRHDAPGRFRCRADRVAGLAMARAGVGPSP